MDPGTNRLQVEQRYILNPDFHMYRGIAIDSFPSRVDNSVEEWTGFLNRLEHC
jgi:hypothetical protein